MRPTRQAFSHHSSRVASDVYRSIPDLAPHALAAAPRPLRPHARPDRALPKLLGTLPWHWQDHHPCARPDPPPQPERSKTLRWSSRTSKSVSMFTLPKGSGLVNVSADAYRSLPYPSRRERAGDLPRVAGGSPRGIQQAGPGAVVRALGRVRHGAHRGRRHARAGLRHQKRD